MFWGPKGLAFGSAKSIFLRQTPRWLVPGVRQLFAAWRPRCGHGRRAKRRGRPGVRLRVPEKRSRRSLVFGRSTRDSSRPLVPASVEGWNGFEEI